MYATIIPNNVEQYGSSCRDLVNYLEKEESLSKEFTAYLDKESQLYDKDYFFNGIEDKIEDDRVATSIDKNCKGLAKNEARFYSITFNPSEKELKHLLKIAEQKAVEIQHVQKEIGLKVESLDRIKDSLMKDFLKEYAKDAMDIYANNFGRDGIESNKDLVWFGRAEKNRYYKPYDDVVKSNNKIFKQIEVATKENNVTKIIELERKLIRESDLRVGGKDEPIKAWMPKSGVNYHVHVIVSRRDVEQRYKLSPRANSRSNTEHVVGGRKCKIGFNRDQFFQQMETRFDSKYNYERSFHEFYENRKLLKENPDRYNELMYAHKAMQREVVKERLDRQIANDGLQNKGLSIGESGLKTITDKAGSRYFIDSIKPVVKAVSLGDNTIRMMRSRSKEQASKLAIDATSRFSRYAGYTNPLSMGINVVQKIGMSVYNMSKNSNRDIGYD